MDVVSLFVWTNIELCGLEQRAFDALASLPELAAYRHWMLHTRQGCEHLLSEKEESLMAHRDLSDKLALCKLYSELNSSFEYKMTVDGQRRVLKGSQLEATRESPDLHLCHRSQEVRLSAFAKNGLMLTGLYNELLKDYQVEYEVRSYKNAIGPRDMFNELSDDIVDALSEVTSANTDMVERYYRLKARMLGVPRLNLADIYAPIGGAEKRYTWLEARSIVLAAYNEFDPRAGKLVGEFFDRGWIHAATDSHKRGGAFCSGADPGLPPYVMLTFSGTARNVETLAHELGHGLHGRLAGERQTILSFHPVMPMAGVASVFDEMLVTQEMLWHITDPAEKCALYCRKLEESFAKSQRQNMFHRFELRTHALAPDHQLSKQELDCIYHEELNNMFHGSVTIPWSFDGEWLAIHHIFLYPLCARIDHSSTPRTSPL